MNFVFEAVTHGVVKVRLTGRQVKRFFRLCTVADIRIWNIECIDAEAYECCMRWNNVFKTRKMLKKTRTSIRVLSRKGLPKWLGFLRNNYGLVIVAIITIFISINANQRIWHISINGNSYLSRETIIKSIQSYDIDIGDRKCDVDCDAIEKRLRIDIDKVCWSSVYIKGTCLYVDVQEQIYNPVNLSNEHLEYSNIYASCDATVTSIITRRGTPMVKAGDEVTKGQILVKGECPILSDDETVADVLYVDADADICGRVSHDYRKSIPTKNKYKKFTGEAYKSYYIQLFDYRFDIPVFHEKYDCNVSEEKINQLRLFNDLYLPVFIGKIDNKEIIETEDEIDYVKAKDIFHKQLEDYKQILTENGAEIISENIKFQKTDSHYLTCGKIWTCELIGAKR